VDLKERVGLLELVHSLAAVLLPYKNKEIYELSTITKYKIAGIPLLSIAGAISSSGMP
jgi:hypothetical protein